MNLFRRIFIWAIFVLFIIGFYGGLQLWSPREVPQENWYITQVQQEIMEGNRLVQEELAHSYSVFVNGLFMGLGYQWDESYYVPLQIIARSLNWETAWLPDLALIQLRQGSMEHLVEYVDYFGRSYVELTYLKELLALPEVEIVAEEIRILTKKQLEPQQSLPALCYAFLINGQKMTEKAFFHQGEIYVPARIFALAWGEDFRYDATKGLAFLAQKPLASIFVAGESYASLAGLKELINCGSAEFSWHVPRISPVKPPFSQGPAQAKIALTFDDYLAEEVYPLLAVLEEEQVKATFFLIGNSLEYNQEILQEIAAQGHLIANHTWDHLNLYTLTDDEIRAQLIATNLKIAEYGGEVAPYFRPPGGFYDQRILKIAGEVGLETILWSLNSNDGDPANDHLVISQSVERSIHPGAIIVMHTRRASTIKALPQLIRNLREQGYEFATIAELKGD